MILTNRELFLLIICTVFYITLFIVVMQNSRRKIQLLQSRLDNIHAMQKMAVIEPRQDVSTLFSSPVYLRIKKNLAEGRSLAESDWGELAESVNRVLSSLSPEIRDVFTARYFYAASLYEISKRTGFSIGKIKSMLHRTRKKLQSELKEEGLC